MYERILKLFSPEKGSAAKATDGPVVQVLASSIAAHHANIRQISTAIIGGGCT